MLRSACRRCLLLRLRPSVLRSVSLRHVTQYSKILTGNSYNFTKAASSGDVVSRSQRLLQSEGSIYPSSPGSFVLLPVFMRSLEKLIRLIDQEMRLIGAQKIMMPSLIPGSLLRRSGRFDSCGSELFYFEPQDLILAPTHEELVCQLMNWLPHLTHRSLPVYVYQITSKYRNEKRPRSALLRTREFLMKDLYTFDADPDSAKETYRLVCQAYDRIFRRLGLPVLKVDADPGNIGGHLSHEYQVLSAAGQDVILVCRDCGHAISQELASSHGATADQMPAGREAVDSKQDETREGDRDSHDSPRVPQVNCPACGAGQLESRKGIEVGHTFLLGTRYTQPFDVGFTDASNQRHLTHMGCFGIGVTRLLAACLEALSPSDQERMAWPPLISPFHLVLLPPKRGSREAAALDDSFMHQLGTSLEATGLDVLIDDRSHLTIGRRLKDHEKAGIPFAVVAGRSLLESEPRLEIVSWRQGSSSEVRLLSRSETVEYFSSQESVREMLLP